MRADIPTVFTVVLAIVACGAQDNGVPDSEVYDVIVIGLGAAGSYAASTLAQAGKRVLALEADGRVGGRVKTVPFGDGIVEVGAEWIHGTSPSLTYDVAVKNNLTLAEQQYKNVAYRSDGSLVDKDLLKELTKVCLEAYGDESLQSTHSNLTVGEHITKTFNEYVSANKSSLLADRDFLQELLNFMNLSISTNEASTNWHDVSYNSFYEDIDGNRLTSWHRLGYKTLFELLLNTYNNGTGYSNLDIKLNAKVANIKMPEDPTKPVIVTSIDDTTYKARYVLVTASIGVLKENHKTLFTPKLPSNKIEAIEKQSIGVLGKIILSFDKAWWDQNNDFFSFIWKGEDKKKVPTEDFWTTRISGASAPLGAGNVLTLWASGDNAKLIETLPEDVVKGKVIELLKKFMGPEVPEPTSIIRSSWHTNPFTRGSYTYDSVLSMSVVPNVRETLRQPLADSSGRPRVLFAGEATNSKHYATVHGAAETGLREANRIKTLG